MGLLIKIIKEVKKSNDIIIVTTRGYSYGGLMEVLFFSHALALKTKRQLFIIDPKVNVLKGEKERIFSSEIIINSLKIENIAEENRTLKKFLELYLDLNRKEYVLIRIIKRIIKKISVKSELFNKKYIGYNGNQLLNEIKKKIKIEDIYNWSEIISKTKKIELNEDVKLEKEYFKNKIDHYVCLYVRDDGYDKLLPKKGSIRHNADIRNFAKSINLLIANGYNIFRLGDKTMTSYHQRDKVVDMTQNSNNSERMNLSLVEGCNFWMGTMGGGRAAPLLLRKTCLVVNADVSYNGQCINNEDTVIFKHVYCKKKKRLLSLSEQLENLSDIHELNFDKRNYIRLENTEDEILEVTREFIEKPKKSKLDLKTTQVEYFETRLKAIHKLLRRSKFQYTYVEQFKDFQPSIGSDYFQKVWKPSNYLETIKQYYIEKGILE